MQSEGFYRLETILFYLKDPRTLFRNHFCPKTENGKKISVLTKIMTIVWFLCLISHSNHFWEL